MSKIHQKIVKEILEKYKIDSDVIGIRLFGSVARGDERQDSDIDIEIVKDVDSSWKLHEKKQYNLHLDFVISTKKDTLAQFDKYPYLFYIDIDKKILYDRTGFLKKLKVKINKYMDKHPEVLEFWNKKFKEMKKRKSVGKKTKSLRKLFDEAEILFSDEHKITRGWFRS